jgi:hypothetical protein
MKLTLPKLALVNTNVGRVVQALEPISCGDIILLDRPFVNVIKDGFRKKVCAYCNSVGEQRLVKKCTACDEVPSSLTSPSHLLVV